MYVNITLAINRKIKFDVCKKCIGQIEKKKKKKKLEIFLSPNS